MTRIDRRQFFNFSAAAIGTFASGESRGDEGDAAHSGRRPLIADRDPLGLAANSTQLTSADVHRAIDDGIRYLKSRQLTDGTWPDQAHYDGGLTPLATLALLHAGCPAHDSAIAKSLEHLRSLIPRSTYTASLQTMVFCTAEPERDMPLVMRNAKWLESRQWSKGEQVGMWSIAPRGTTDHTDNSMTHFAMLALYEAERLGVRVRPVIWQRALDYWRAHQNDDGSWGWGPKYPGSGSMTCAGIAAIVIAMGRLDGADAAVRGDDVVGCQLQRDEPTLVRAFDWLARGFSVVRNPGTEYWHSYYLYALERVGRMTAQRFVGNHDWYREGARALLATQQYSGAWPPDVEFQKVADQIVSTSFSLMFLSKGRWPVVMAHLKHGPDGDWNRHRAAPANLVSHVEQAWARDLTYQVVDLSTATVEDLLESPVLFLQGREAPQFTSEEIAKLRQYLDRGGFLFAERCCGGEGFDAGFRQLIRAIFSEPDSQLRLLPPDHPVWFAERPIAATYLPPLWGVDVSCRTAVVYCPADLSAYWELDRLGREHQHGDVLRSKLLAARQAGINVLTYATGRDVQFKSPAMPLAAAPTESFERGKLHIANVLHPGGCHAAPAALSNLLRRAADDFRVAVSRTPHEADLASADLFNYHVLFMHGRAAFELTPLERERLREYLQRGGTLVADAICSSQAFTQSFRREMRELFPTNKLSRIPADDPIFSPGFGGADVTRVSRRKMKSLLSPTTITSSRIEGPPELEGLRAGDRYVVLFSSLDISCALESETASCAGYVRQDAIRIAVNILLYSLNQ